MRHVSSRTSTFFFSPDHATWKSSPNLHHTESSHKIFQREFSLSIVAFWYFMVHVSSHSSSNATLPCHQPQVFSNSILPRVQAHHQQLDRVTPDRCLVSEFFFSFAFISLIRLKEGRGGFLFFGFWEGKIAVGEQKKVGEFFFSLAGAGSKEESLFSSSSCRVLISSIFNFQL